MPGAVRRVFDDLLNIEVNTMVKPGMTGRKMPAFGHALLDIYADYQAWLNAAAVALDEQWTRFRATEAATTFRDETIAAGRADEWWVIQDDELIDPVGTTAPFSGTEPGTELFSDMRTRARTVQEMHGLLAGRRGYSVRDGGDVMLQRIVRNCDQLKAILERAPSGDQPTHLTRNVPNGITGANTDALPSDDLITIRKAWEMGTEVVALQTVVQIDGDVVTRLNSAYAGDHHQPVRDLHRESVGTALDHWRQLVDTAVTLAKNVAGIFT